MRKALALCALYMMFGGVFGLGSNPDSVGHPLLQQTALAEAPSIDQILDKHIASLGGKALIEALESALQTGTFETMGNILDAELGMKAPGKWYIEIRSPDSVAIKQGSNGTQGWVWTPYGGVQDMPRDQWLLTSRLMDPRWPLRIKEYYHQLTVKGTDKVGDRITCAVEATPKEGPSETMQFDAETGQILRLDVTVTTPQGPVPVQIFYEDYRDVNGVKTPFTIRQVGPSEWTMKVKDVKNNVAIDDAKFARPQN